MERKLMFCSMASMLKLSLFRIQAVILVISNYLCLTIFAYYLTILTKLLLVVNIKFTWV